MGISVAIQFPQRVMEFEIVTAIFYAAEFNFKFREAQHTRRACKLLVTKRYF
jgi:hypothetical protein